MLWQRKALLTVLFVGLGQMAVADDYMPFVQEGKQWFFNAYGENISYLMEGDTVIGDRSYKKLWLLKNDERTYQTAVREEGRVVYAQHPNEDKEEVICYFTTFGQKKCELTIQTSEDGFIHYVLSEFYPVQASTGRIHRVFESGLVYGSYSDGHMIYSNAMWYEGVGNVLYPKVFSLTRQFLTGNFVGCYVGDTCIFNADDAWNFLWDYSGLSKKPLVEKSHSPIYDLQGRQLSNGKSTNRQMRKGVYIQDGRKVVR